jgi:hypothetical protein
MTFDNQVLVIKHGPKQKTVSERFKQSNGLQRIHRIHLRLNGMFSKKTHKKIEMILSRKKRKKNNK